MVNREQDSKAMEYWNEVRVKRLSTDSEWMDEVYDDALTLVDLARTKGISDKLRCNYTNRAIEALEEVVEFLNHKEE